MSDEKYYLFPKASEYYTSNGNTRQVYRKIKTDGKDYYENVIKDKPMYGVRVISLSSKRLEEGYQLYGFSKLEDEFAHRYSDD